MKHMLRMLPVSKSKQSRNSSVIIKIYIDDIDFNDNALILRLAVSLAYA